MYPSFFYYNFPSTLAFYSPHFPWSTLTHRNTHSLISQSLAASRIEYGVFKTTMFIIIIITIIFLYRTLSRNPYLFFFATQMSPLQPPHCTIPRIYHPTRQQLLLSSTAAATLFASLRFQSRLGFHVKDEENCERRKLENEKKISRIEKKKKIL